MLCAKTLRRVLSPASVYEMILSSSSGVGGDSREGSSQNPGVVGTAASLGGAAEGGV